MQTEKLERMKYLTETLNQASKAYYAEDRELMSNLEYDTLYEELEKLEQETGIVLTNSPTVRVGYEAVEELPKERHESPMLSLGKTKDREELRIEQMLEVGRADDCAYIRGGKACKGSHPGKRGDWGGGYQQCQNLPEYPHVNSL